MKQLFLVVPLVKRGIRIYSLVALQPNQLRPHNLSHHVCDLGLTHSTGSFDQ